MNSKQAKQIDMVDFLKSNNINYIKHIGDNYWYCSPLREENTASFKIDRNKNLWYDHGIGEGGNIIDFVMKANNCNFSEALFILESNNYLLFNHHNKQNSLFENQSKNKNLLDKKDIKQEILKINNLENYALLEYVKSRKIDIDISKKYLFEIFYKHQDKKYFALAFKNDSKDYEIRSKYFKGTIGTKNITTIKGIKQDKLVIFEGFFDFLSALTYYRKQEFKSDVIVLNSIALTRNILELIGKYKEIFLFLDNDKAGQEAKNLIKESFKGKIIDKSSIYEGYNDFNEFLQ